LPRLRLNHGAKRQLLQVHELRLNQRMQLEGLCLVPLYLRSFKVKDLAVDDLPGLWKQRACL